MTYDFPTHIKGDTYKGTSFTILVNELPLNLTSASIKMSLKTEKSSMVSILDLSTANNKISITSALEGKFQIVPQIININAGLYYYDIQIILPTGIVKTYVEGQWTILQDVTV